MKKGHTDHPDWCRLIPRLVWPISQVKQVFYFFKALCLHHFQIDGYNPIMINNKPQKVIQYKPSSSRSLNLVQIE